VPDDQRQSPRARNVAGLDHRFDLAKLAGPLELDEAKAAVRAGLALDPSFTIRRFGLA
jgi:hypothetical protein